MQDPLRAAAAVGVGPSGFGGRGASAAMGMNGLDGMLSTSMGAAGAAAGDTTADLARLQRALAFPHRLSMYRQPPPVEVSMEEFETFALDRLQSIFLFEGVYTVLCLF
jgi:hypothetical protein